MTTYTPVMETRQTKFIPSPYQQAIFNWIKNGRGDAIVNAVAGSGKTTTLIQAASLLSSRDAVFCAFNTHIAKELGQRLQGRMECKTIHSIGNGCLYKELGKLQPVDANKYNKLIRREARNLANEVMTVKESDIRDCLRELVNFCQCTLTNPRNDESYHAMIDRYSISIPNGIAETYIQAVVKRILDEGEQIAREEKIISFSDMIWLPAIWNLYPRPAQWVFVDECQDLSTAQLHLVLKLRAAGGRMIFVGDPRQAIYGFAGADAESYWNIKEQTSAQEFPLSVCYRCPVLVIRDAQQIVPQIEPAPLAELGTVRTTREHKLSQEIAEGDLILCRMTAPLVKTCLELIAQKVPARVRGRDIGKQLSNVVAQVSELDGFNFSDFPKFLDSYVEKQIKKLSRNEDNESQIERWRDIKDALTICFESYLESHSIDSLDVFQLSIESLFSDERPGVWLATVHRAKGLENPRVFILKPEKLPLVWKNQQEWEFEQEMNLKYVAITRAQDELVYVTE